MKQRGGIVPVFFIFLILSVLIFFFFSKSFAGVLEALTLPVQKLIFKTSHSSKSNLTEVEKLREENDRLLVELAKKKEQEKEIRALRDQFETADPSPRKLLPAEIVGISTDKLIIDKGTADGVKDGSVVVVKDNLVGKVTRASSHLSVVHLVTHEGISFTAQTVKTSTPGIINGRGGTLLLENVVLSDKLEKGDIIVTKGDMDSEGNGYPNRLVVGKVASVSKRASALFQVAQVKSLVDVSRLEMVFVMTR